MLNNRLVRIFDGNYEIVYSETFNVFNSTLLISFAGLNYIFNFPANVVGGQPHINVTYNGATATIVLNNFRQPTGASSAFPYLVWQGMRLSGVGNNDNTLKRIYFSVKSVALTAQPNAPLEVTITFYSQDQQ